MSNVQSNRLFTNIHLADIEERLEGHNILHSLHLKAVRNVTDDRFMKAHAQYLPFN